jgi:hypothetical protein
MGKVLLNPDFRLALQVPKQTEVAMNDKLRQQSVKAYFDAIAAKNMSQVPWAEDATLRTPLNPAGGESALIRGRQAILELFQQYSARSPQR